MEVVEGVSPLGFDHAAGSIEGWPVYNATGLGDELIMHDPGVRELASKLSRWVDNARAAAGRSPANDQGAYIPADNFYAEVRSARHALKYDDVVQGVYDITESFAFQGVKWQAADAGEADVMNQWAATVDLDSVIRRMWREEYAISQCVVAMRWGQRSYRVRGKGPSGERQSRKVFDLWVPTSIHVLDSLKIVPVMHGPLGSEALAWSSTNGEVETFLQVQRGLRIDPEMLEFYLAQFRPDEVEAGELGKLGIDTENLILLNPQSVWRHTTTKADYERFPDVRLRSIFHHLDLKRQLINSDRAALIGSANYILLVKKGSKEMPATTEELNNLQSRYNYIAKMPVIISDHRLEVEIIAPKTDFVLNADKYNVVDNRILTRLLGTLTISQQGQRNETNITLARAVAKSMQNRRHMLKRSIERNVSRAIVEHPRNAGAFTGTPKLVWVPRMITLDADASLISALLSVRTQREISRETILEVLGLDQAEEAARMEFEEEEYGDIFPDVLQPGAAVMGAQGGRPPGGGGGGPGSDPDSAPNRTPAGNPSTGGS